MRAHLASPFPSRAALAAVLCGAGLLAAPAAMAVGSLVDVRIVDRDTGAVSPLHGDRGQWHVAGRPGARYAIRISNRSGQRVLAVMSVDGVNIVSGQTASFEQSGYVLEPWQSYQINGWRKSQREVAAFVYTALPDSYAARTGRPDEVGVIGVAVFNEQRRPPPPVAPAISSRAEPSPGAARDATGAGGLGGTSAANAPSEPGADRKRAESDSRAVAAESPSPSAAPARQERLGTGHGERETSYAGRTTFQRASRNPAELVSIRYDSHENLVAAGIIRTLPALLSRAPNPFPASDRGFVPDPPR